MKRILSVAGHAALACLLGTAAYPAVSVAAPADHAGITLSAKGEVWAAAADSRRRELKRKSKIFESDELGTGAESTAQFRMKDGATFGLAGNTRLKLSEYRHTGSGDTEDSAAMELVEGSLRFVTGAIGKQDNEDWVLKAGEASIGIRGTDGEVTRKGRKVYVTIYEGRLTIHSPDCPETLIGRGTKFNFLAIDESGCDASFVPEPFSQLPHEVFDTSGPDKDATEGGGGGGDRDDSVSLN